jgi:hypothetical protein
MAKVTNPKPAAAKRGRRHFSIYGFEPNASEVLVGCAQSNREAGQMLRALLDDHPKVTFVEIMRFRNLSESENSVRKAVGKVSPPTARVVRQGNGARSILT